MFLLVAACSQGQPLSTTSNVAVADADAMATVDNPRPLDIDGVVRDVAADPTGDHLLVAGDGPGHGGRAWISQDAISWSAIQLYRVDGACEACPSDPVGYAQADAEGVFLQSGYQAMVEQEWVNLGAVWRMPWENPEVLALVGGSQQSEYMWYRSGATVGVFVAEDGSRTLMRQTGVDPWQVVSSVGAEFLEDGWTVNDVTMSGDTTWLVASHVSGMGTAWSAPIEEEWIKELVLEDAESLSLAAAPFAMVISGKASDATLSLWVSGFQMEWEHLKSDVSGGWRLAYFDDQVVAVRDQGMEMWFSSDGRAWNAG